MSTTLPPHLGPQSGTVATDLPPRPPSDDTAFFGHPRGLSTLFFTEMWERFSYYGIRPLLVLFMTAAITRGGFGFDSKTAGAVVGIYASSVYLSSLPGGWIADRLLGLRRSIRLGAILIALGHICIGLSALLAKPAFFAGLGLIVIGTGLLKPNISATPRAGPGATRASPSSTWASTPARSSPRSSPARWARRWAGTTASAPRAWA